jgi:hypothetical protein
MPDGDVYAKRVPRPWVKAARFVFEGGDDAFALDECEKALASQWRERPWDGLIDAVRMIAEAQGADRNLPRRRQALDELKRFASAWPADRLEALLRVANRELAGSSTAHMVIFPGNAWHDRGLQIAAAVLAESVIRAIAPAGRAHRLERTSNLDAQAFVYRATETRKLLCEAPGILHLANQVLRNANGGGQPIRASRTRVSRLSQIDLVNLPIG